MDWLAFLRWFGAGMGAGTAAFAVVYLFSKNIVVSGMIYADKCAECQRERERAEKAEQRLIDTIPVLTQAYEQVSRLPRVAVKAVEVVKNAGGK